MADGSCDIVGISISEEGAKLTPGPVVEVSISEITTQTAGKLFVGIRPKESGEIRLGLEVSGQSVEIFQNEREGATYIDAKNEIESYAIDLPMRIIGDESGKFPKEYSIRILWGKPSLRTIGWQGASSFILRVTGRAPKVRYDPIKDSN